MHRKVLGELLPFIRCPAQYFARSRAMPIGNINSATTKQNSICPMAKIWLASYSRPSLRFFVCRYERLWERAFLLHRWNVWSPGCKTRIEFSWMGWYINCNAWHRPNAWSPGCRSLPQFEGAPTDLEEVLIVCLGQQGEEVYTLHIQYRSPSSIYGAYDSSSSHSLLL
jgi:hypothetical protein